VENLVINLPFVLKEKEGKQKRIRLKLQPTLFATTTTEPISLVLARRTQLNLQLFCSAHVVSLP
jgi:hypothetical protein